MAHHEHVDAIEHTVQLTYEWLRAFGEELGQRHLQLSYRSLRAGLHVIRDQLPPNEAAAMSAQLPMLLRGVFFEGWRPGSTPARLRHVDDLYDAVAEELEAGPHAAPRDVMRATFAVLNDRLDPGEIRKIRHLLGEEIRRVWPEPPGQAAAHEVPSP
jgi:uncharacterized protein (DUF2267 family)